MEEEAVSCWPCLGRGRHRRLNCFEDRKPLVDSNDEKEEEEEEENKLLFFWFNLMQHLLFCVN